MSRALPRLLALAALAACAPPRPSVEHTPDPSLGLHLLRVEGSVPGAAADIEFKTALSRPRADGSVFVFAQHSARREFADDQLSGGASFLLRVHDDDRVEALPPPPTGALIPDPLFLVAAPLTGAPAVIVDGGPAGHVASVYLFDGQAWRSRPLLLHHLAGELIDEVDFDAVRVLDEERVLFRLGTNLVALDGERYARVPTPPGAVELGLGPADAEGVRLFWTDAAGRVHTARLDPDWALEDEVALSSRAGFRLADARTSGTSSAFTLDLQVAGGPGAATLYFHEGGFLEVPRQSQLELFQTPPPTPVKRKPAASKSTAVEAWSAPFAPATSTVQKRPVET